MDQGYEEALAQGREKVSVAYSQSDDLRNLFLVHQLATTISPYVTSLLQT